MNAIKLEASYTELLSLNSALNYALQNSLPIRITQQSAKYQKCQLFGNMASALPVPSIGMTYGQTVQNIVSSQVHALNAIFQPTILLPIFQGGSQFYTMLGQYYRNKGWHESYYSSINDALMDVYQKYEDLVLQKTLLQVRLKAVEVSQTLLQLNMSLYKGGAESQLAIAQSRTQLGSDRQALIDQEAKFRLTSMALAYAMNAPLAVNLVPEESLITEQTLIDHKIGIDELLDIALKHRPELRQYEYFHLASRRNIPVATAPLYPTASLFGEFTMSETNQTQSFFAAQAAGGNSGSTAGAGVFGGIFDTTQGGYALNWNFSYAGLPNVANIAAVRALSRQTLLQANQELQNDRGEVREDYATMLCARAQIDNAAYGESTGKEALKQAQDGLRQGNTSNLELLTAQSNYLNIISCQAESICSSNIAQAKLLHDMGVISVNTLLHGFAISEKLPKHPSQKPTL